MFSHRRRSTHARVSRASKRILQLGALTGLAVITVVAGQITAADRMPDLERALVEQRALVHANPGDPVALNDLGNLLELGDRYAEAEAAYRDALALDSGHASARFNLALLLMQRGDMDAAEEGLRAVLEADPLHAWAHYELGVIAERGGERHKAIDLYARAFGLDPALSFPEVNPHVIDNELVTQSLLEAQKYHAAPSNKVPRQYGDRVRIASLMLGVEPSPDAASLDDVVIDAQRREDAAMDREVAEADDDAYGTSSYQDDDDEIDDFARSIAAGGDSTTDALALDERGEDTRVLTTDDLDDSDRTGEVVGGNQRTTGTRGPGSVFNRYRAPNNRTPTTRSRTTPTTRSTTGTRDTTEEGGRVTNRGATTGRAVDRQEEQERQRLQRFRPTRRSSAQLDLVLEPVSGNG